MILVVLIVMRKYYRDEWLTRVLQIKKDKILAKGPVFAEHNKSMLGLNSDESFENISKLKIIEKQGLIRPTLVIQIVGMLICPLPWYDRCFYGGLLSGLVNGRKVYFFYSLNTVLMVMMGYRLVFPVKTAFASSDYTNAFSKSVGRMYGFQANTRFAIKCWLNYSPGTFFVVSFVFSVVTLSAYITLIEMPWTRYE